MEQCHITTVIFIIIIINIIILVRFIYSRKNSEHPKKLF